jgi:hypothetical protein
MQRKTERYNECQRLHLGHLDIERSDGIHDQPTKGKHQSIGDPMPNPGFVMLASKANY